MSDLSDQIRASLRRISDRNPGTLVDTDEAPGISDLPALKEMQRFYTQETIKTLRKIYRKHAGTEKFESANDALERTRRDCVEGLLPICASAFADGVQIGQGTLPVVKKFHFFKKIEQIFGHDGFREESELYRMTLMDDEDTVAFFKEYLYSGVNTIAMASGFTSATGANLARIWDLWGITLNSVAVGLYASGNELGNVWRENDVLNGIMSATEAKE